MSIDTTAIGTVAAQVMEDIDRDVAAYKLSENARVVAALVIYEIQDDGFSTVGARVTDDRNVIGLGLVRRAELAMLEGD